MDVLVACATKNGATRRVAERIAARIHQHGPRGAIDPPGLTVPQRLIFRAVGGRYGAFRNGPDIDRWAEQISTTLTTPSSPDTPQTTHPQPSPGGR